MSVLYSLFVHRADAGRYLQRAEAVVFARHRRALRGVARDVVLSEAAENALIAVTLSTSSPKSPHQARVDVALWTGRTAVDGSARVHAIAK